MIKGKKKDKGSLLKPTESTLDRGIEPQCVSILITNKVEDDEKNLRSGMVQKQILINPCKHFRML